MCCRGTLDAIRELFCEIEATLNFYNLKAISAQVRKYRRYLSKAIITTPDARAKRSLNLRAMLDRHGKGQVNRGGLMVQGMCAVNRCRVPKRKAPVSYEGRPKSAKILADSPAEHQAFSTEHHRVDL